MGALVLSRIFCVVFCIYYFLLSLAIFAKNALDPIKTIHAVKIMHPIRIISDRIKNLHIVLLLYTVTYVC